MTQAKVVVAQIGAREHYQIPRMCHDAGALVRLHTDFWKPVPTHLQPLARRFNDPLVRRALGRFTADIPTQLVRTHSLSAAYWNLRLRRCKGNNAIFETQMLWGERFATRVARDLMELDFSVFFGFSSGSLEAMGAARRKGAAAVLDVIAPIHLEEEILAEERRVFPGWEPDGEPIHPGFLDRLEAEWAEADRIMVNSTWTKQALIQHATPARKIHVVPICFETESAPPKPKHWRRGSELRVLWLGTMCLRKGLPYALEAARRLESRSVQFTFAGPTDVDLSAINWPSNTTYVGQVPRMEVSKLWATHHVFLLPTLSDGFAITQIEAMAHGLPVLATKCCGDVVEDGRSGLLIAPRAPQSIADAIERILDGDFDLEAGSEHALARANQFTPAAVWAKLRQVLSGVSACEADQSN